MPEGKFAEAIGGPLDGGFVRIPANTREGDECTFFPSGVVPSREKGVVRHVYQFKKKKRRGREFVACVYRETRRASRDGKDAT